MKFIIPGQSDDLDERITRVLLIFGISPAVYGFRYLHHMVRTAYSDPFTALKVTKTLYPNTAKIFRTRSERVQSLCRECILSAYEKHGLDAHSDYFDSNHRPLRTGAFIQLTAEKLRRGEL
ncbi:MAG: hypothetical protein E7632_02600 [Ruminococcaceae bacterium]|nr:hypothetical protein [Oscillospiraceae bacterium]